MSVSPALATAASLPPELVEIVVDYIGTDDRGYKIYIRRDCDRDLAAASMVCVEWANACRRRRFEITTVNIRSPSDLQTLESFTTNGSQRLEPLHSIVGGLAVRQNWDSGSRSWCHSLSTSAFYKMTASAGNPRRPDCTLVLSGPVPTHLPRAAYHTPIWDLPRTLPSSFLPFTYLVLQDIRFPSLSDMLTLWSSLACLKILICHRLTWDKADVSFVDPGVNVVNRYRPRVLPDTPALFWVMLKGCSDNALVVALALRYRCSDSRTPFSSMESRQRDAYLAILRACMFTGGVGAQISSNVKDPPLFSLQAIPGLSTENLMIIEHRGTPDVSGQHEQPTTLCTSYWLPGLNTGAVPASTRYIVGLKLEFLNKTNDGACAGFFKQALEVFRSKLAAFPHLKVAGVTAEPETILQDITQALPELGQRPTGEAHQDLYWRWGSELYTPQDTETDAPQDTRVDTLQDAQI